MNIQDKALNREDRYWNKDIETISRKKLERLQVDRLKDQLEYVYKHSSFYRDNFVNANFNPEDFGSMEDVQRIPITHKDELRDVMLQSHNPFPHLCVSKDKIAGFGCSRGTSGTPTFSAFTQEDIDLRVECYTRSLLQIGLTKKSFFHSMIGIQSITHFVLKEATRRLNVGYINDGVDNIAHSIHIGRWLRPTVLLTGVRTLYEMEKKLKEENKLPKDVFNYEKIILYGDVIGIHFINHVKERWGIPEVFSLSGSAADLLWYNFDCAYHTGNHCLNEDVFLVEIIDPMSQRPVQSGEKGELVVTDLSSKAAPHIRWNLEDIVIPFYEPCRCGRTHMRLKYLGRALYEVNIKGEEIFPVEIEHFLWNIENLEGVEFRIVKYAKEMDHLKLQIEFGEEKNCVLQGKISHHLKDKLGIEVEVEFVAPGKLPVLDIKTPRVLDLTKGERK